jgi:hypothetical protein
MAIKTRMTDLINRTLIKFVENMNILLYNNIYYELGFVVNAFTTVRI